MSSVGYPKGGVPQGTVSGPRNFIMFINDLTTTAPIYKYVDDSTIFEVCKEGDTSQIQESVDMVDIWTSHNHNDMRLNSEKCKDEALWIRLCICKKGPPFAYYYYCYYSYYYYSYYYYYYYSNKSNLRCAVRRSGISTF